MSNLVNQYYKTTSEGDARQFQRGQLCLGAALYLPDKHSILELKDYNPKDEHLNRYAVLSNPPLTTLFNHTPVKEINLQHNEELLVIKAKKRPLFVISQAPIDWRPGSSRLRECGYVCLPVYGFHEEDQPEFRARVRALEYPWWIYLPEDSKVGMREGFIRLDRIQVVEKRLLQPVNTALTDDALFLISEWLRYYVTGEIDSVFLDDRQSLIKQLG